MKLYKMMKGACEIMAVGVMIVGVVMLISKKKENEPIETTKLDEELPVQKTMEMNLNQNVKTDIMFGSTDEVKNEI